MYTVYTSNRRWCPHRPRCIVWGSSTLCPCEPAAGV